MENFSSDNPFGSPTIRESENLEVRVKSLNKLRQWAILALLGDLSAYTATFVVGSILFRFVTSVSPSAVPLLKNFVMLALSTVAAFNSCAAILSAVVIFLVWRKWSHSFKALVIALLAVIPIVSLVLLFFAFRRSGAELEAIRHHKLQTVH